MEFRILGSVEVADGGETKDLGGLRERTLLARLLLSAGQVVSADRLAEDLWAGEPPPHCMATLRVYISRLRRALGSGSAALLTQPPGYRMVVGAGQLDAGRFASLVAAGREDLAAGQPAATLILGNLSVVALNRAEYDLARTRFEEHLANARRIGDRKLIGGALTNLGTVLYHTGDLDTAAELHAEALALAEQLGDRRLASVALTNLGLAALARKDYPAARDHLSRSLDLAEAVGERRAVAEALEELAGVDAAAGEMDRAAVLFGASQALRAAIGAPVPEPDLARINEGAAAVRLALGDQRYEAAQARGMAMSAAEAIAVAKAPDRAGA